jgi:hypothetical protein
MKPTISRTCISLLMVCLFFEFAGATRATLQTRALPNPVLYLTSQEAFSTGGKNFIRYRFDVLNRNEYPDAIFAASPALPPCGNNTKASRTWVDIYEQNGTRLNGFCALGKPNDLQSIWFALEDTKIPPSYIYIELTDRQTNTKYKSNLAETTM